MLYLMKSDIPDSHMHKKNWLSAALKFIASFCAFWDFLAIFGFDLKVAWSLDSPTSGSITKEVFCKTAFLVSSGGRNCCSCGSKD